jgi:hypothetical protein
MESERPRVPWLSMHCTSRAGASEVRNCPAWLPVGDGIGGGPDEHAVTAQPSTKPTAVHRPAQWPARRPGRIGVPGLSGCLRCRTYGSLSGDRLYYRDGQRPDPVRGERRGKSSHRCPPNISPTRLRRVGVVFPKMS